MVICSCRACSTCLSLSRTMSKSLFYGKKLDSILHYTYMYFSNTGEQPPSPKRVRAATASESEDSEIETDTRTSGGSAGAIDTGSSSASSESKQST